MTTENPFDGLDSEALSAVGLNADIAHGEQPLRDAAFAERVRRQTIEDARPAPAQPNVEGFESVQTLRGWIDPRTNRPATHDRGRFGQEYREALHVLSTLAIDGKSVPASALANIKRIQNAATAEAQQAKRLADDKALATAKAGGQ